MHDYWIHARTKYNYSSIIIQGESKPELTLHNAGSFTDAHPTSPETFVQ